MDLTLTSKGLIILIFHSLWERNWGKTKGKYKAGRSYFSTWRGHKTCSQAIHPQQRQLWKVECNCVIKKIELFELAFLHLFVFTTV